MLLTVGTGDGIQDEDCMQRMIRSVLATAIRAGVTSLAMPLLGCGVARWLMPLVAKATIQEVLKLAEDTSVTTTVKVSVLELHHQILHAVNCCPCTRANKALQQMLIPVGISLQLLLCLSRPDSCMTCAATVVRLFATLFCPYNIK